MVLHLTSLLSEFLPGLQQGYSLVRINRHIQFAIAFLSDIRTVQELLGHPDVSSTMIYTNALNKGGFEVKSPAGLIHFILQ